jgi:hypothetical protein
MEKRLKSHWTEFDRMVRRLGALRRERDGLLGTRTSTSPSRVVAAFGEAVAAVYRFGADARVDPATAADQAWNALDRAADAAQQARQGAPSTDGAEP